MKKSIAVTLVLVAGVLTAAPARANPPDLSAPEERAGALPAAPPAPKSNLPAMTTLGVMVGASMMLVGTWAKTTKANKGWTRGGLAVMVFFPVVGVSMDMAESTTWEAVPSR